MLVLVVKQVWHLLPTSWVTQREAEISKNQLQRKSFGQNTQLRYKKEYLYFKNTSLNTTHILFASIFRKYSHWLGLLSTELKGGHAFEITSTTIPTMKIIKINSTSGEYPLILPFLFFFYEAGLPEWSTYT